MRLVFVVKGVYVEVNTDLSINLDRMAYQIFLVDKIVEEEGKGCVEERKRGKVV